jgi:hypothetical protein
MKKGPAPTPSPSVITSDIGRASASEPEARYSPGEEMASPGKDNARRPYGRASLEKGNSPQLIVTKKEGGPHSPKGTRAARALVTRSRGIHFLVLLPLATA